MSAISVIASLTAGGKYIQVEKEPVREEVPQGATATTGTVWTGTRRPDKRARNTIDRLLPDSAGRLTFVIGQLTRRLRSAHGGLSHSRLSAFVSVARHGPLRHANLVQAKLVSAPSITRLAAELEAQSLLSRLRIRQMAARD